MCHIRTCTLKHFCQEEVSAIIYQLLTSLKFFYLSYCFAFRVWQAYCNRQRLFLSQYKYGCWQIFQAYTHVCRHTQYTSKSACAQVHVHVRTCMYFSTSFVPLPTCRRVLLSTAYQSSERLVSLPVHQRC